MKRLTIKKYSYLDDNDDIAWYAQYGCPRAASGYPGLRKKRARIARLLQARGIDLKDFNGYPVDHTGNVSFLCGKLIIKVQ